MAGLWIGGKELQVRCASLGGGGASAPSVGGRDWPWLGENMTETGWTRQKRLQVIAGSRVMPIILERLWEGDCVGGESNCGVGSRAIGNRADG